MKMKNSFLLLFAASFLIPSLALADIAPDTSTVGALGLAEESAIVMTREKVIFKIPKNVSESQEKVPVVANFWLKNPTNEDKTIQTIFPIYFEAEIECDLLENPEDAEDSQEPCNQFQYAKNVTAKVNGKAVTAELKSGAYAAPGGDGKFAQQSTAGYVFPLTVRANKTAKVVIKFDAPLGLQYRASNLSIDYLLASGAGWSGKIGKAEIQFVYPFKLKEQWVDLENNSSYYDTNNIKKKIRGRTATWTFTNFEPVKYQIVKLNFVAPSVAKKNPESNTVPFNPYADE